MLAFTFLIVIPALALAQPSDDLEKKIFDAIDANKDGKITKLENEQFFLGFNADKDGVVTKQEFFDGIDKMAPQLSSVKEALYKMLDDDNSGQVDKSDIDAVFTRADKNNDNHVSKTEFHEEYQRVASAVVVG